MADQTVGSEFRRNWSQFSNWVEAYLQASATWLWEADSDLRLVWVSCNFRHIFGLAAERLLGSSLVDGIIRDEDRAAFEDRQPISQMRCAFHDDDGATRWNEICGVPVIGSDGSFAGYRGTGTDITARVADEARQRIAQEQLSAAINDLGQTLADACPASLPPDLHDRPAGQTMPLADAIAEVRRIEDGIAQGAARYRIAIAAQSGILDALPANIALLDSAGVIIAVNEGWRRFAIANAFAGEEYGLGVDYVALCEAAEGESSEQAREIGAGIRGILTGATDLFSIEYPCHSPTGQHWFRFMAAPIVSETIEGAVLMHFDITERKLSELSRIESEQQFRDFGELASDWFWHLDADLRIRFEPSSGGQRSVEDVPWPADAGDDAGGIWQDIREELEARQPFRNFRYSFVAPSGRRRHWRASGKPVFDKSGQFRGYRGTATDETEMTEIRIQAERAEARLLDAIASLSEGFVLYDAEDRLTLCNARLHEMLQCPDLYRVGATFGDICRAAAERGQVLEAVGREEAWIDRRLKAHRNPGPPLELRLRNGRTVLISERRTSDGGIAALHMDITALREAEEARRQSDEWFRNIVANLPGTIFRRILKPDGTIELPLTAPSLREVAGADAADAMSNDADWWRMVHQDDVHRTLSAFLRSARELVPLEAEYRIVRPDGQIRWMRSLSQPQRMDNGDVRWDGITLDVTDQKQAEAQLTHLAYHDPLTDLPNRSLFRERLTQALAQPRSSRALVAVHYLDLDYFKEVNDTLGHSQGDQLLGLVAERLARLVRRSDTVARLGGDEFAILQPGIAAADEASALACRVLERMAEPIRIGERNIVLGVTIGIGVAEPAAIREAAGADPLELLKHADIALYEAKRSGRNNFRFYAAEMDLETQSRMAMRQSLHKALERNQFHLHYQPQVRLETREIIGAEALIRWDHPELGLQRPDRFIPIAEESGLIVPIGEWVLREACRQAMAWQREGLPPIKVSVNVSAVQFLRGNLIDAIRQALEESGLEPQDLELELTESILMTQSATVHGLLEELREVGVGLAVDDFGTGYSSFRYLKSFPIDKLKIDQSFVRDMTVDSSDAAIVRAIIAVGKSLGLEVVAEGVETAEQSAFMLREGCFIAQGYLYSMPLVADDFAWLAKRGLQHAG